MKLGNAIVNELLNKIATAVIDGSIKSMNELKLPLSSREEFEKFKVDQGFEGIDWEKTVDVYKFSGVDLPIPIELMDRVIEYMNLASQGLDEVELEGVEKSLCEFFTSRAMYSVLNRLIGK
jgi:hypothetical protein